MSSDGNETPPHGDNFVGRLCVVLDQHQVRHRVLGNPGRLTCVRIVRRPRACEHELWSIKKSRIGGAKNDGYNNILRKRGAGDLSRWKSDHRKWPAASDSGDLQPAAADRCCPLSKVNWAGVCRAMVLSTL